MGVNFGVSEVSCLMFSVRRCNEEMVEVEERSHGDTCLPPTERVPLCDSAWSRPTGLKSDTSSQTPPPLLSILFGPNRNHNNGGKSFRFPVTSQESTIGIPLVENYALTFLVGRLSGCDTMRSSWRRNLGNVRSFVSNSMGGLRGGSNIASWVVAGTLAYFLWVKPAQDLKREQEERAALAAADPNRYVEKRKPMPDPQQTGLIYGERRKIDRDKRRVDKPEE